ncbi:hypothetical protein [Desulfosporosinus sp. Sb-LF]|uniref:hypothetical protein n=1 Tax=Desulfosporosinus sp. Sb-LF TaxID=2560027 RepID=UPI00107FC3F5|nr:hypothetical protein [Desulfosporosinus sp. Sb-LF]TGE32575.1 hypothetical protein E4K68_10355 [Desulfosporosinus sp. Sb-LF]
MLFGRNRFLNPNGAPAEGFVPGAEENANFLNPAQNMPLGMQRFLAKKGINSPADLANRMQFTPRMPF